MTLMTHADIALETDLLHKNEMIERKSIQCKKKKQKHRCLGLEPSKIYSILMCVNYLRIPENVDLSSFVMFSHLICERIDGDKIFFLLN